jgi:hypothetical protein
MHLARLTVVVCCIYPAACANTIRPAVAPPKAAADALVVLPGFGYNRDGERAFRALAPAMAAAGLDLYLPTYLSRFGLDESRERLQKFLRDGRFDRYERVHVFAFLAGGRTFNPLVDIHALPNLSTVVFDRSPYQERAPRIAVEELPFLAWVKYGGLVFDLARTPYEPLTAPGIRVGLLVETMPTSFVTRFRAAAARQGPYQFECDAFRQRYDDCFYVAMSHNELYPRFAEVWPEVRSFVRTGQFTAAANRTPPVVASSAAARY